MRTRVLELATLPFAEYLRSCSPVESIPLIMENIIWARSPLEGDPDSPEVRTLVHMIRRGPSGAAHAETLRLARIASATAWADEDVRSAWIYGDATD